jgi:hypothetical protein
MVLLKIKIFLKKKISGISNQNNITNHAHTINASNNLLEGMPSIQEHEMQSNIKNIITNQNLFDTNHEHTIETKNKEYKSNKCCDIICGEKNENENKNENNEDNEMIIHDQKESTKCCFIF